jgi:DNA-binding winged helix-turn-helix (wHTH) protein
LRYVFGAFVLDEERRALTRDGRGVPLTPRAFELLRVLVRARPRAVGKAALLRAVWSDSVVSEASLTQRVNEVRKALGDRARDPRYLRTVFKHGYAFCGEVEGEEVSSSAAPVAPTSGTSFYVLTGGRRIPLVEGENLIGRDPAARVYIDSRLVSRHHALIAVDGQRAVLHDLKSKNGTFLGSRAVTSTARLAAGDQIAIGEVVVEFLVEELGGSTQSAKRGVLRRP